MPGEKRSLTESEGDVSLRASVSEENRSLNNIFKQRRADGGRNTRVYIENISFHTTEDYLGGVFSSYGRVTDVYISPRGYGFVTFTSYSSAIRAIEALNSINLQGNKIKVRLAWARSDGARDGRLSEPELKTAAFLQLLQDKKISGTSIWARELTQLEPDPRFQLMPSTEWRQVFDKYVKERADMERKEKKWSAWSVSGVPWS